MTLADRSQQPAPVLTTRDAPPDAARPEVVAEGLTLEEYLALPDEDTSLEYDHGLVTRKMAPQADHGSLQGTMLRRVARVAEERRLGLAFTETRFVTPDWAPVPDVSYYRAERLRPQSRRRFGDFHEPPDIAVEIVSPGQSVSALLRKCLRYAELGVTVSLLVDPDDESIFDVRPGQPLRVPRGDDRIDLEDVLPGFELTVRELFATIVPDWLPVPAEAGPAEAGPAEAPADAAAAGDQAGERAGDQPTGVLRAANERPDAGPPA